ncbi:anti-sigma factor [Roseovarius aestuarii]|nr:anti-sigma factor [Roseovarius aestuarii]
MSAAASDRDEDRALAGEYALGLLEPDAAAAFEARLLTDPDLRAMHAEWAQDFASLTDDFPEVTPPARIKAAVHDLLFPTPPRRNALMGWVLGGLMAAGLAVFLLMNSGLLGPSGPGAPTLTAMITAEDGAMVVAAAFDDTDGTLNLERTAGAAVPGRSLELWLIAGDNAPVSLGVLTDGVHTSVTVPDALRGQMAGGTLAITDEPLGGSPTGGPTGAVMATGVVTPV